MAASRQRRGGVQRPQRNEYDWRRSPDLQDELDDEDDVDRSMDGEVDLPPRDPNRNPFVLPELGQVPPPDYPFKWADQPVESRPGSPQEEFIRSPYPLELATLARRWTGLHSYEEIEMSFQQNNWRLQRFNHQDKVARGAVEASLAADVQFKSRIVNESIVALHGMRETIARDFESAYEYEKATNAGPLGYVKRPMGVRNKSTLAKAYVDVDNALMTRVGIATQIHENNVNVKVGPQKAIADYLTENDPEYAELLRLSGAGGERFASNPPAIEQGGSIHDWRQEFDSTPLNEPVGGRLYEVDAKLNS